MNNLFPLTLKQLMHCLILFPIFFLKYLTNAEHVISR